jgi:N-methylhydantoinase A
MSKRVRIATDVGGTFTDLVYFESDDETGEQRVRIAKSDTTPPNFDQGIVDVLKKANVDVSAVSSFVHGTTVVINALTERRGAKTGLITTEGFRDVLEIARGTRPDFFNMRYKKPAPFVPRHLRREVPGRLDAKGSVLVPLDLGGLEEIVANFRDEHVEAVAVCLLHAYANPEHERAVVERLRALWPGVSIVASHQITREWREYERTNTAVLSAYVQPIAHKYLSHLEARLRGDGYRGSLFVMQSNCGVDTVAHAKEIPITMVESGPASGMWGAAALGRLIGESNLIALDIGGTTAKCSLVAEGLVQVKTDYYIEKDRQNAGYPIMVPVVDLVEIGNGGGSIAWVDEPGRLHVGPKSAGAVPGPAAYGRGGLDATTTDANLMLGRINPEYFCGGELVADMPAVERAMNLLAERLGLSVADVAKGIVQIADNNMVNALKLVSLNRGYDPREFTLVAFGGGGGMHAVSLARELGVKKVVVPRGSSVFSAWGMMMSDLRRDYFLTKLLTLDGASPCAEAGALLDDLATKARGEYAAEDIDPANVYLHAYVKLRYQHQEHAVEVLLEPGEILANPQHAAAVVERFHSHYERQYTYRLSAPVELVGVHIVAMARVGKLELAKLPIGNLDSARAKKGSRDVDFAADGIHQAAIYDSTKLEPGMKLRGPAVIEDPGTTIVIYPGNAAEIDEYGNTCITNT